VGTPKKRNQKPKKFVEELPCKLGSGEYETHAELLAKQISVVAALEEQRKLVAQDFKERILLAERELEMFREAVETHTIKRQIECIEEIDFERNRARVIRLDTDELVRERAITGDERAALAQGELIGGDGAESEEKSFPRA
jgi:hypothetical protein